MLAVYRLPLGAVGYEVYFGLWLNAERVQLRAAVFTAAALAAVQGKGSIERVYFDALCRYEEEVAETESRTNAARELAAMRGMR